MDTNKFPTALYKTHRKALMRRLPDGLILLSGGSEVRRNRDVNYVFRQDSDFLYLTGVEEPGWHLLLDPKTGRETLFVPQIDHHHRVWQGHVPSPDEAKRFFGVGRVVYSGEMVAEIKKASRRNRRLYADAKALKRTEEALKGLQGHAEELEDALQELRAVKDPEEIRLMQWANRVSGKAHRAVMAAARPGMREYEVQAVFESECLRADSPG